MQNVKYARENKLLLKESNALYTLGETTASYPTSKGKRMYFKVDTSKRDDYIPLSFVSLSLSPPPLPPSLSHTHTHTTHTGSCYKKMGQDEKAMENYLKAKARDIKQMLCIFFL